MAPSSSSSSSSSSSATPPQQQQQQQQSTADVSSTTPPSAASDQFMNSLLKILVDLSKTANGYPDTVTNSYLKSISLPFGQVIDKQGSILLNHISNIQIINKPNETTLVNDIDDNDDRYESCVDLLDHLLENVDTALDELEHPELFNKDVSSLRHGAAAATKTAADAARQQHGLTAATTTRPQDRWNDIDNSSTTFVPKLTSKPNAKASLERSLDRAREDYDDVDSSPLFKQRQQQQQQLLSSMPANNRFYHGLGIGGPSQHDSYPHPYEPELLSFEFTREQLQPCTETLYGDLNKTPCTWIDTESALMDLAAQLECVSEFAIDLEQHSYRSFQGFVCLMQISTRDQDYLVDTLELREHMQVLNTSFTNPRIVKVMHGSDSDIVWLQRDFGLYVVNMFDTGQASRVLEKHKLSLAYLLKYYCDIDVDKKYQLADWRIRPLPSEMVKYARQDTHYLLYVYDRLRNELLSSGKSSQDSSKLKQTLQQSRALCLRRYEKERFDEMDYISVLSKFQTITLTKEQENVFRALYKWRDSVSRREDESVRYVMPNHMMHQIAEALPTTPQKLVQCCNPVPRFVRRDAKLLVTIIEQAMRGTFDDELITGRKVANSTNAMLTSPLSGGASYSLSSPISSIMERQKNMESPVMTADQLFGKAGWVEESAFATPHKPLSFTFEERELLADQQKGDDVFHFGAPRPQQTQSYRPVIPVMHSNQPMLFPTMQRKPQSQSSRTSDNAASDIVAQINSSFSFESIASPSKRQWNRSNMRPKQPQRTTAAPLNLSSSITTVDSMVTEGTAYDADRDEESMTASQNDDNSSETTQQQQQQQEEKDAIAQQVPKSLNEIYKISKKNRKQKLTVKKGGSNTLPSPATHSQQQPASNGGGKHQRKSRSFDAAALQSNNTSALTKNNNNSARATFTDQTTSSTSTPTVDEQTENSFLKKIGWI